MKSGKRRIALLLAFALCLGLGGCAGLQTAAEPYQVYLVVKSTTTEFWKSVFAGANAAKSEYNVELTILGAETEDNYEEQNDFIRQAILEGADAIVFSAISYTGNAAAIDEAAAAGIQIVVIDSDVDSDAVCVRIGTDNVEAGRISAAAALDTREEALVVGIVNCDKSTQNGQEREQGFREKLLADGRVKGIYTVNVPTDRRQAKLAAERLLLEHPDINVLIGFNEPLGVGVAQAIDELGRKDTVRGIAFDSNVKCIEYLQTGVVSALVVQNPYAMGYLGIEKAWQALQGQRFDGSLMDTATTIVTPENMFTMESQKAMFSFT